jgi:hypothetical protein
MATLPIFPIVNRVFRLWRPKCAVKSRAILLSIYVYILSFSRRIGCALIWQAMTSQSGATQRGDVDIKQPMSTKTLDLSTETSGEGRAGCVRLARSFNKSGCQSGLKNDKFDMSNLSVGNFYFRESLCASPDFTLHTYPRGQSIDLIAGSSKKLVPSIFVCAIPRSKQIYIWKITSSVLELSKLGPNFFKKILGGRTRPCAPGNVVPIDFGRLWP